MCATKVKTVLLVALVSTQGSVIKSILSEPYEALIQSESTLD